MTSQNEFPDGGHAALFNVNNEFGQFYVDAFEELAGDAGFEIVDQQTIEAAETRAADGQVEQHRRQRAGRDHGGRRSAPSAPRSSPSW